MKRLKYFSIVCIVLFNTNIFAQSNIVINEIVAKNNSSLITESGLTPDWIELYNPSNIEIILEGYSISDNNTEWVFPKIKISANGYIILLASDLDIIDGNNFHTNFKLSSEGEAITLRDASNLIIDSISYPSLEDDQSYGRSSLDQDVWQIFSSASLARANDNGVVEIESIILRSSHESGFYPNGLALTFPNLESSQTVYYSLDGSKPDLNSTKYSAGETIEITQPVDKSLANRSTNDKINSLEDDFPTTAILRAIIYENNTPISDILNQTFWLTDNPHSIPVVSLIGEEADFFDDDLGIYVRGNNENYFQKGEQWERPIYASFFDSSGELILEQAAGIRLGGAKTRQERQKTLRLFARSEYGNSHFDYPFWGNEYGDSFKRITLRTFKIGSWSKASIMDDLIHEIIDGHLNVDYVKRHYSAVYLNGNYWGIHSMREHNNQHFIERKYGVNEDDVVIAKARVNADDSLNFDLLVQDIQFMDLNNHQDYQELASRLDIEKYTDYMLTNITFANRDWPHNNIEYWYSEEYDGKLRFIINDMDATMTVHNDERLDLFISDLAVQLQRDKWLGNIIFLQKLLEVPAYRDHFNQRLNTLLHTTFSPSNTISVLNSIVDELTPEISTHINRWHFPKDEKQWHKAVDGLEEFLLRRPNYLLERSNELFGFPIKTYPNPITNQFYLELETWSEGEVVVSLYDINGLSALNQTFLVVEGIQKLDIDTSSIPKGTYVLNVQYLGLSTNTLMIKID